MSKTLEVPIYGDIGENFWTGEGITPKSVKDAIDKAGAFSEIVLRINSLGGNAFDGVAIYNLIRSQGKPVTVKVDGIAASAASIIAMAGDTVTMGRGSMMMLHNPWIMAMGSASELRETADVLDKLTGSMADIYVAKSGREKEDVLAIMEAETWLSAQDAIDKGFATSLADEGNAEALAAARKSPLLAKLKNVPDVLKEQAAKSQATSEAAPQGPPAENLTVIRERFKIKHKRRA